MINSQSVEQDEIVAGNIFAMLDNANRGVNRMKFISLAAVPYILPFVKTELGKANVQTHRQVAAADPSRANCVEFYIGRARTGSKLERLRRRRPNEDCHANPGRVATDHAFVRRRYY